MYINFQVEYTNYTCVYRYPVMLKLLQLHIYIPLNINGIRHTITT